MDLPKDTAWIVLFFALVTESTLVAVGQAFAGFDALLSIATAVAVAAGALALFAPREWTRIAAGGAFVLYAALLVTLRVTAGPDATPFALAMQGSLGAVAIAVAAVGAAAAIVSAGRKTPAASPA